MMTRMQAAHEPSTGGRLVTADGRTLPLRGVTLRAEAQGGVARAVLVQRFANVYAEPLHVTYLMPLPADGAVSGYASVYYTHLRAHETPEHLVCRLLLE